MDFSSSQSKLVVVTMACGDTYQKKVEIGIENKRQYCQRHGYDFIYCQHSKDFSRDLYWSKIQIVIETMTFHRCEWVVWVDADTLFMNMDVPLINFVDGTFCDVNEAHLLICED